jgi:hypothetical protein
VELGNCKTKAILSKNKLTDALTAKLVRDPKTACECHQRAVAVLRTPMFFIGDEIDLFEADFSLPTLSVGTAALKLINFEIVEL